MSSDVARGLAFCGGGLLIILTMVGVWHRLDTLREKQEGATHDTNVGGVIGYGTDRGNGERQTRFDTTAAQTIDAEQAGGNHASG